MKRYWSTFAAVVTASFLVHLYFSGTPTFSLALGAVFSALDTTSVHGHTALFGVYGMLGIGLMLFCLRSTRPAEVCTDRTIALAFWCIHGGLMAMVVLSVLPVGLLQTQVAAARGGAQSSIVIGASSMPRRSRSHSAPSAPSITR